MKFKLLLLLAAFSLSTYADSVSFSYDSAGNRIKREIVIEKKSAPAKTDSDNKYLSEILSEKEIRIYPNPTDGELRVTIQGFESSDECRLAVYSMGGQLILSHTASSDVSDIDISSQPNGMYILLIILNGEESSWKIIKK